MLSRQRLLILLFCCLSGSIAHPLFAASPPREASMAGSKSYVLSADPDPSSTSVRSKGKSTPPLALHPANPHYFLFRNRPAILITSGEHYGAVLNQDFDYTAYLEELQKNDLNLTRLWSGSYREVPGSFGITQNTLAPAPDRYLCPWPRSATPGATDGGAKFDLTQWNAAYFQRLHAFMEAASRRGVVVEMNLFCPNYDDGLWKANPMQATNNTNGVGACPANEVYTLRHPDLLAVQDAMVRKIVTELAGYDNLYYEVCNEPYFGGVTLEWQKHIVQTIVQAEQALPHPHLISMNIANGKAQIRDADPAVSIFNFHYATPPVTVGMNYGLNKVIGENETGFRGKADTLYRSEAWAFLLAGGGLYNNLDYSFTVSHPDGTFTEYNSPGGGSPALRHQLKILKGFLTRFDYLRMAPDKAIFGGALPAGVQAEALVEAGRQYAIYLQGGKLADLSVELPAGNYMVQWLDTLTGKMVLTEKRRHAGGAATLKVPPYGDDIALSIRGSR